MAKKPALPPLPALDSLPASPLDHPTLHAIVQGSVKGTTQRDIATKHRLELAYIRGVIAHYLR